MKHDVKSSEEQNSPSQPSDEKSRSESPDGEHEEDDNFSSIAVGAASPLNDPQSPLGPCVSSALEDELEGDIISLTRIGPVPRQLALSKQNLASFEHCVKEGKVPLRVDVIGGRSYAVASHNRSNDNERNVSMITVRPSHSEVEESALPESIGLTQGHTQTHRFYDSLLSHASTTGNSVAPPGAGDKGSLFSMEVFAGSPLAPEGDRLDEENLSQHLRDLRSGIPVPLQSENIPSLPGVVCDRCVPAGRGGEMDHSLEVDPSEADPTAALVSDVTSLDASLPPRQLRTSTSEIGQEEWSTHTTFSHEDDVILSLPLLSKENLRRLRRQLEAGETPLRPEVLASLGDAVGMHKRRCGAAVTSMHVEVCHEDSIHSFPRTALSSGIDLNYGCRAASKMNSPPSGRRDHHSISLRSTLVEATMGDIGESDDATTPEIHDTPSQDHDRDHLNREGSVFLNENATTDDGNDLSQLNKAVLGVAHAVKGLEREQMVLKESMEQVLRGALVGEDIRHELQSLRQEIDTLRRSDGDPRNSSSRDSTKPPATCQEEDMRLAIQVELPGRSPAGVTDSFIIRIAVSATVRDCKEAFLRRLAAAHLPVSTLYSSQLTTENTTLYLGDHALFDTDVLGADLQVTSSTSKSSDCVLILRRNVEEK